MTFEPQLVLSLGLVGLGRRNKEVGKPRGDWQRRAVSSAGFLTISMGFNHQKCLGIIRYHSVVSALRFWPEQNVCVIQAAIARIGQDFPRDISRSLIAHTREPQIVDRSTSKAPAEAAILWLCRKEPLSAGER
jgi:hypothetical protein